MSRERGGGFFSGRMRREGETSSAWDPNRPENKPVGGEKIGQVMKLVWRTFVDYYWGVPLAAIVAKVAEQLALDVEGPLGAAEEWSRIEKNLREADSLSGGEGHSEELLRSVAACVGDELLAAFRARQVDVDPENLNLSPEEKEIAAEVATSLVQGQPDKKIRETLLTNLETASIGQALVTIAESLQAFRVKQLTAEIRRSLEDHEVVIFEVPPKSLLSGAVLAGEGFVPAVQNSLIKHPGKKRGIQIAVVYRENGVRVVVKAASVGGRDDMSLGVEVDWQEPVRWQLYSDSRGLLVKFLRAFLKIDFPLEVGVLVLRAPGRSGKDAERKIAVALTGGESLARRGEGASLLTERIRKVANLPEILAGMEQEAETKMASGRYPILPRGQTALVLRRTGRVPANWREAFQAALYQAKQEMMETPRAEAVMLYSRRLAERVSAQFGRANIPTRDPGSFAALETFFQPPPEQPSVPKSSGEKKGGSFLGRLFGGKAGRKREKPFFPGELQQALNAFAGYERNISRLQDNEREVRDGLRFFILERCAAILRAKRREVNRKQREFARRFVRKYGLEEEKRFLRETRGRLRLGVVERRRRARVRIKEFERLLK